METGKEKYKDSCYSTSEKVVRIVTIYSNHHESNNAHQGTFVQRYIQPAL